MDNIEKILKVNVLASNESGKSIWDDLTGILDEKDLDLKDPKVSGILKNNEIR